MVCSVDRLVRPWCDNKRLNSIVDHHMSFHSYDYDRWYSYIVPQLQKQKHKVKCDNCNCVIGHSKHPGPFGPIFYECVLCELVLCNDYKQCEEDEHSVYVKDKLAYYICSNCSTDTDEKELEILIKATLEDRADDNE